MRSHSVTCHPAEVTFPPLPQLKLVLDLATPEGCKAELIWSWHGTLAWCYYTEFVQHSCSMLYPVSTVMDDRSWALSCICAILEIYQPPLSKITYYVLTGTWNPSNSTQVNSAWPSPGVHKTIEQTGTMQCTGNVWLGATVSPCGPM